MIIGRTGCVEGLRNGSSNVSIAKVHSCLMFHLTILNIGYLQYSVKYTGCSKKFGPKRVKG